MIKKETITITGASGTGYSDSPVDGLLEYIKVTYTNGAATGDVTITDEVSGLALLTLTDNTTNFSALVRGQASGITGSALTGVYDRLPISSRVKVVVAQENANTTVQVDVWYSSSGE